MKIELNKFYPSGHSCLSGDEERQFALHSGLGALVLQMAMEAWTSLGALWRTGSTGAWDCPLSCKHQVLLTAGGRNTNPWPAVLKWSTNLSLSTKHFLHIPSWGSCLCICNFKMEYAMQVANSAKSFDRLLVLWDLLICLWVAKL